MKSSAAVIAESLSEFGRSLRETELPNDVETTERILETQTTERNAIKEDFRISIRKGLSLLKQVRQAEQKPTCEQLSPNRLNNVTAIERMLGQLEDTERSFDAFWAKHRQRLTACLRLRRFEEAFRKASISGGLIWEPTIIGESLKPVLLHTHSGPLSNLWPPTRPQNALSIQLG